jgi:hypothetical protein
MVGQRHQRISSKILCWFSLNRLTEISGQNQIQILLLVYWLNMWRVKDNYFEIERLFEELLCSQSKRRTNGTLRGTNYN